ncbi:hypothetical protein AB5N19_01659 [Seiridium cardinale]|uniref:Glycosyltransferase 2-like domain-containing protein n=1 Tax=Seiridium cardinale TaxID=138064 RepID=A0ABR2XWT6_9PEZI
MATPSNEDPFAGSDRSSADGTYLHPAQKVLMKRQSQYLVPRALVQGQADVDSTTKCTTMLQFLHRRMRDQGWLEPNINTEFKLEPGLILRVEGQSAELADTYLAEPPSLPQALAQFATRMDLAALVTLSSDITSHLFAELSNDNDTDTEMQLVPHNITVPVVNCIADLATQDLGISRRDYCCLVRQERVVLAWTNQADQLLIHAADIENKLMGTLWGAALPETPGRVPFEYNSYPSSPAFSRSHSFVGEKNLAVTMNIDLGAEDEVVDEESLQAQPRSFLHTHSFMIGMVTALLIVIQAFPIRLMIVQLRALGDVAYTKLALAATIPFFSWFALFFAVTVVYSIFEVLGPVSNARSNNSQFHSGQAPSRQRHPNIEWPHVTIQMPVYKEGLKGVIIPTLNSVLAAIRHYENLGGTASIFVCEDGIQASKPEVAEMRKQFYAANSIGWCARPAHGDGFVRAGKFKKASNMNYCLSFSLRVEAEISRLLEEKAQSEKRPREGFTVEEEKEIYNIALQNALEKDGGKTLAAGNVRIGEIILIIDCDTRVPVDCLSLGAMEMEESPEVAIIQHASGIMQVAFTIFENFMKYFNDLVYTMISLAVGAGDTAPFVGHNAFIRWKALQFVALRKNGETKFWSEEHVSEDFEITLRLQNAGFITRLATYDHGEFKEGVSLTASDELLRWEKYAYGVSELVFNPVYKWLWKGPFTMLFLKFLFSRMKICSKISILAYMGTYYAIAAALPTALANYLLFGWFDGDTLDHSYTLYWNTLCGTLFIFLITSPVCFAWYRHRIGQKMFLWALLDAIIWMPFFLVFFSGLSWHISYALLAHLLHLPIGWTSTAKEVAETGLVVGIGAIIRQFKCVIAVMLAFTSGMIYLGAFAPVDWQISGWPYILPLGIQVAGHFGVPMFTMIDFGVHISWGRK